MLPIFERSLAIGWIYSHYKYLRNPSRCFKVIARKLNLKMAPWRPYLLWDVAHFRTWPSRRSKVIARKPKYWTPYADTKIVMGSFNNQGLVYITFGYLFTLKEIKK